MLHAGPARAPEHALAAAAAVSKWVEEPDRALHRASTSSHSATLKHVLHQGTQRKCHNAARLTN